jgi:hypothetical protein
MAEARLDISEEYTRFPAGRFRTDGRFSGERFRDDYLVPKLRDNDRLTVILDGTMGFGSSFLEETFGGLVRNGFTVAELESKLDFVSSDKTLISEIWDYIRAAD